MAHNHNRSVAELRRESERTRAELSQTVEILRTRINDTATDLRQKVSPDHIKAGVSDYVTAKGRNWFDSLKQQAMDNPMQTLAAGTAIAVPALKLIRSVPAPLLMIGAGLVLTSPRVRGAVADKLSEALETADGGNVLTDAADAARERWQSARSQAEDAADDARNTMGAKAAEMREAASQLTHSAKHHAAELSAHAKDSLGSAKQTLSSTMDTASETTRIALDTTRTKAAESFKTTRASAETIVRDRPALVAGLGLALGALIAASLPSTRTERSTMGQASNRGRKTGADAASQKLDDVKDAAETAAQTIADAADRSRPTENATAKLKTVTDEAITTAFDPSQTDHR
ncbi:DUF3618 domain-containing protein [Bradyrhizobium sp. LHD-71]|uniref:DUF3618 domain-containing protein n=1 Tax=Bradyrhizobium sp. LHD-71 TaxID=3072141 RepID=UPI00280C99DA|nr:DUF3618 domain-containing protein [Bradyrhizobium sp. LHD-71]MDQ8729379.1 DUF3618 domain-containing protein [Bradyrhizobium sp. LHD-71]